jgi:peptidoglycan DL-endopeptidase CwlO
MQRPRAIAVVLAGLLGVVVPALPAGADAVKDKQREAARVADRIEQLGNQAESLGEDYNDAVVALADAKQQTDAAQQKLDSLENDLGGLKGQMSSFAVRAYVYADQTSGIAGLLSGESLVDGTAQRLGYSSVALGVNMDAAGDLRAKLQDVDFQRAVLRRQVAVRETLTKVVDQKRDAVQAAEDDAQALLVTVKGELATLVQQEEERRAAAAAAAARAALAQAQAQAQANARVRASTASARPAGATQVSGGGAASVRNSSEGSSSGGGTVRVSSYVPPPSSGAAGAVAAAMSQLGVPYRFAAASPGVAFDCSGLSSWAWSRAGVSLPHSSRAQAAMLTNISVADLQPGDLIFSHNPVSHVGIYVGNGMMIHAPHTGTVVQLSPISRNITSIGRPG